MTTLDEQTRAVFGVYALDAFVALRDLLAESEQQNRTLHKWLHGREPTEAELAKVFAKPRAALAPFLHLLPKDDE